MRYLIPLVALCLGMSTTGRADTIFNLTGNTYGNPNGFGPPVVVGSASGTIRIDTALGRVDAVDVSISEFGATYTFDGAPLEQYSNGTISSSTTYDSRGGNLTFILPVGSLVGYGGGLLCTLNNPCVVQQQGNYNVYASFAAVYAAVQPPLVPYVIDEYSVDGSLTARVSPVATPEPAPWILLATGLLGGFTAMRRLRFTRTSGGLRTW